MGAGEWIALAAVCGTILGSAAAVVWRMARLDIAVQYLTQELHEFRVHVKDEHRELWRAVNQYRGGEPNEH